MKTRGNKLLKWMDRYVGIPLVMLLGMIRKLFRAPGKMPTEVKEIVMIKTIGLGDTVLLSGILSDLKEVYPRAQITMVCSKNNQEMAALIPGIDKILIFNLAKPWKSLVELKAQGKYDLLFDFSQWMKFEAIISYFVQASYKIGFENKGMYRHYVYDQAVRHSDQLHELENYRKLVQVAGIPAPHHLPEIKVAQIEPSSSWVMLLKDRYPYIIVHPYPGGARSWLREWPENQWIELIQQLLDRGIVLLSVVARTMSSGATCWRINLPRTAFLLLED